MHGFYWHRRRDSTRLCLVFASQNRIMCPCSSACGEPSHMDETSSSLFTKKIIPHTKRCMRLFGAEGETRTLAPVSRPTPLAGAPRHQLEYFCKRNVFSVIELKSGLYSQYNPQWRREWDSNPRYVAVRRFSRPFRYNHFGISPYWAYIY